MNCLVWNCQGLGQLSAVQALLDLVQQHAPKLVFICETHGDQKKMEGVCSQLGFGKTVVVPSQGRSGGLCLMWADELEVVVQSSSMNHIDVLCGAIGRQATWRLTGFYGFPARADRHRSWELLTRLGSQLSMPWLCVGDFNEIVSLSEKAGGVLRSESQMDGFRDAMHVCELHDMGFIGARYTWKDRQENGVSCRLDRGLATRSWSDLFPRSRVIHLDPSKSDHLPLLIEIRGENIVRRGKKRFRFEEMWTQEAGCGDAILEGWSGDVGDEPCRSVWDKIKNTRVSLLKWHQRDFGNTKNAIKEVRDKLGVLFDQPSTRHNVQLEKSLHEKLDSLLSREETYWRQRARTSWLREGDRNTAYFHRKASNRRSRNIIKGLRNVDGVWQDSPSGIEHVVLSYFNNIFLSQGVEPNAVTEVLEGITPCVSPAMNEQLLLPFSDEEIRGALFQMHPSKAPGPDGMSPLFYQKYWHIVGPDVTRAVRSFLLTGSCATEICFTHVVLIPKVKVVEEMSHLRPIN